MFCQPIYTKIYKNPSLVLYWLAKQNKQCTLLIKMKCILLQQKMTRIIFDTTHFISMCLENQPRCN